MTTSEQAAWAKAEAERGYEPKTLGPGWSLADIPSPAESWRSGFAAGVLHVLSLLESETAVEAAGARLAKLRGGNFSEPLIRMVLMEHAKFTLAAAVGAITQGGSKS